MSKQIIHSDQAPAAIGAYSQAVRAGNTVYLSGQIPLDPASMEMVAGGFAEQAHQVFKNLRAVCEAAGGSLNDIVKLNAYLTDLSDFAVFNQVMAEYFAQPYPARAAVGVAALPRGALGAGGARVVGGEGGGGVRIAAVFLAKNRFASRMPTHPSLPIAFQAAFSAASGAGSLKTFCPD